MVTSQKSKTDLDDDRLARDCMRHVKLSDARICFIYRMTVRVNANRSSVFRDKMDCTHYKCGSIKSLEHL